MSEDYRALIIEARQWGAFVAQGDSGGGQAAKRRLDAICDALEAVVTERDDALVEIGRLRHRLDLANEIAEAAQQRYENERKEWIAEHTRHLETQGSLDGVAEMYRAVVAERDATLAASAGYRETLEAITRRLPEQALGLTGDGGNITTTREEE